MPATAETEESGASTAGQQTQPRTTSESGTPVGVGAPNHVYIGKRPVMSYTMSALIQLVQAGECVLKARGMVISRAVDVAEIVAKRLGNNAYEVKDVKTDTERLGEGQAARNVSTIEIAIAQR